MWQPMVLSSKNCLSQNDWLVRNPGKTITIHDLFGITSANTTAYIARNIAAGFSTPRIYPFSRLAFCNDNFQSAEVTNRPRIETFSVATSDN